MAACAAVYVPAGQYVVGRGPLNVTTPGPFSLRGDGWTSQLLWASDTNLLQATAAGPVGLFTIMDIAVVSTVQDKAPAATALSFPAGAVKSLFSGLLFLGQGTWPGGRASARLLGSGIDLGAVSDTTTVRDTVMWFLTGTGVKVGRGSEVRILGGRIIGNNKTPGSFGIHVTGNNGGVHIASTDVISLDRGVLLDSSNGHGSSACG